MAHHENKKHRWLFWLNLVIVLPTLLIWIIAGFLFRDAGVYIAIIFIPLIVATYLVLIMDAMVGIKALYRKLARKA